MGGIGAVSGEPGEDETWADRPLADDWTANVYQVQVRGLRNVDFRLKNVDFRLKKVDFLLTNVDLLLKNVDFIIKTAPELDHGCHRSQACLYCELQYKFQLSWQISIENAAIMENCP